MSISGVGATPEPQNNIKAQNPQNIKDGKPVSIFDSNKDGIISTEEQEAAFVEDAKADSKLVSLCKQFKINFQDMFKNFGIFFKPMETDGTEASVQKANEEIKQRILLLRMKIVDEIKNPESRPTVMTSDGVTSDDSISYLAGKIASMGLELDGDILIDILVRYDYMLNGEDSIISPKELQGEYQSQYMEHDFDGNIKDTHVLDFIANKYAEALKNKE